MRILSVLLLCLTACTATRRNAILRAEEACATGPGLLYAAKAVADYQQKVATNNLDWESFLIELMIDAGPFAICSMAALATHEPAVVAQPPPTP